MSDKPELNLNSEAESKNLLINVGDTDQQVMWLAENQAAITKLNAFVEQKALFSDEHRVL